MTTSSDHRSHSPTPDGEHWSELTATLTPESTECLSDWLSEDLAALEDELRIYVTPNSLRRSFSR